MNEIAKTMQLKVILLGFVHMVYYVDGAYKKWVPNTNFDNPANWNAGRLPCKNDVIKFPESVPPVYVQMNATVQEIVLPLNGELILSNFMSLSFPSQQVQDSSCVGQDIAYVGGVSPHSWFSPDSWCEVADPEGACMSEPPRRLDTERLPCQTDTAIFPTGASFSVDLESGVDVYLGKLLYQGQELTTGGFRSFASSPEGRQVFRRDEGRAATSVNVRGDGCTDITGCACGNDGGLLEKKVCALVEESCPDVLCHTPLLPEGHCCHICGSVMLLEYGAGFKYKSLEGAVLSSVPRALRSSVHVVVSRTSAERIQIVIEDADGSDRTGELADIIQDKVSKDPVTGISRYRISAVHVTSSSSSGDAGGNSAALAGGSTRWGGGSIASLVAALVLIVIIVLVAMYCLVERRRNPNNNRTKFRLPLPAWAFQRFGSREDRSGLEMGASVGFKDNLSFYHHGRSADTLRGFDNPTYGNGNQGQGNGQADNSATGGISTIDLNEPTFVKNGDSGFSNPLYQDASKIENLSFSGVNMNPVFTTEGLEEDSEI